MTKLTQTQVRKIYAKHLSAAIAEIQDVVGQTHGDIAGQYHHIWDNLEADFASSAQPYLNAECLAAEGTWTYAVNE